MKPSREADARIGELLGYEVRVLGGHNDLLYREPGENYRYPLPEFTKDDREAPALLQKLADGGHLPGLQHFSDGWIVVLRRQGSDRFHPTIALAASSAFLRWHGEDPERFS